MSREKLKESLESNLATITFTKSDGTERVMKCTLREEYLPPQKDFKEYASETKVNDNVLAVWDIENNGWRSFRIDSVKSIKVG